MSTKREKDPTVIGLKAELRLARRADAAFGDSHFRRGYRSALQRAIEIRKRELKIEAVAAKGEQAAAKVLEKLG